MTARTHTKRALETLSRLAAAGLAAALLLSLHVAAPARAQAPAFDVLETTIAQVHAAYAAGTLTARDLVQAYLDRIAAYDQQGPAINAIITLNDQALDDAQRLDDAFARMGLTGPLHGIPVIIKDQVDVAGMPTTMGSVLFADYYPDRDAFVTEKLREAGAIILAKATLGELAGGDTHGSLFGSTRNPYGLDRTAGGSSGGPAASLAANFSLVAVGQEGFASIRRPSTWNNIVGMRTSAGLVSRGGVFAGWPEITGHLGPMARTVADLAILLDAMVGYDPEDPLTAYSYGHIPDSFQTFLDRDALQGARLGVLRESMGVGSEPGSEDYAKVDSRFDAAVRELAAAGATLIDPIVIPDLNELLRKRSRSPTEAEQSFETYFGRSRNAPFASIQDMIRSADFERITVDAQNRFRAAPQPMQHYASLQAREQLMVNVLQVFADHDLDAIVYKGVEHQPTLIADGVNPPYVNTKGISHLNTFLVYVPAIVVPAGFTTDDLPVGMTFLGRPYDDGTILGLAYAYEQATHHRRPPATTPPLR